MLESAPSADQWLGKLTQLRAGNGEARDGVSGPAPHKPLLLLSIIDLAESGRILGRVITATPELVLRFRMLGTLVADRWPTRLQLRLPFYYLKTQGFRQAFTREMQPAQSPQSCAAIELHPEFFALLADRDFRVKTRVVLIARYFTEVEKASLFECLDLASASGSGSSRDVDSVLAKALADGKRKGRSARFQVRVVDDYHHTCALTGYRCFTADGASIVDAAHIVSWAKTQNDDLRNGLALSKNAHWMFDRGLWSVDDNLQVIIASGRRFSEAGPESACLRRFAGRYLQFDPAAKLRPSIELIRAHRREYGFAV